jgi:hypothetical protein
LEYAAPKQLQGIILLMVIGRTMGISTMRLLKMDMSKVIRKKTMKKKRLLIFDKGTL